MYSEETLKILRSPIIDPLKPSGPVAKARDPKPYWIPGALIAASLLLGIGIIFTPSAASAWSLFSTTDARADSASFILPGSARATGDLDPSTSGGANSSIGGAVIRLTDEGSALLPIGNVMAGEGMPARSARIATYLVREGDSLSEIAESFDISTNTIIWANGLEDGAIHPGMTLAILPVSGVRHTVASGDTVASIAAAYDADADEIISLNGTTGTLAAGTSLIIPGASIATKKAEVVEKKATPAPAKKAVAATVRSLPALTGTFGNPVPGGKLSQGIHGQNAVDLAAPSGTPIYAASGGTVKVALGGGAYNAGYGNYVVMAHAGGVETLYAHMSRVAVSAGASVEKGTLIGYVGSTGLSTGNHVHFEVRGAKNPFGG